MRGKVDVITEIFQKDGITPAYAGKSEIDYGSELSNLGSPPPMRGKVRLLYHRGEFFRITPAYAGKSSQLRTFAVSC